MERRWTGPTGGRINSRERTLFIVKSSVSAENLGDTEIQKVPNLVQIIFQRETRFCNPRDNDVALYHQYHAWIFLPTLLLVAGRQIFVRLSTKEPSIHNEIGFHWDSGHSICVEYLSSKLVPIQNNSCWLVMLCLNS